MTTPVPVPHPHGRTIGIALGSGSARGLAHIGVLQALRDMGIEPTIVCGSSMGALVGACYASGNLDAFAEWVCKLSGRDVLRYLGIRLLAQGGVAEAGRLIQYLRDAFGDPAIEDLPKTYAAVATDLYRGREVWLQQGSLWDAVRASIAIPGMLTPTLRGNRWLVDGALVNPVPVSLCRALGADLIIAVNLNSTIVGRTAPTTAVPTTAAEQAVELESTLDEAEEEGNFTLLGRLGTALRGATQPVRRLWSSGSGPRGPGTFEVMLGAINVMQDRITRSRLAGEPPDVMLAPRLYDIGLLDYQRGAQAIAAGRACVERLAEPISHALELAQANSE
jgi:NTE family protein